MYDDLAEYYHLIYPDWEGAILRQSAHLDQLIRSRRPCTSIHDCACGIGTQVLGLAALGYACSASDLSERAVARLIQEAAARSLDISCETRDMRMLGTLGRSVDVVICCDNSITHLEHSDDILATLQGCRSIARRGVIISVRDYDHLDRTKTLQHLSHHCRDGIKHFYFQHWEFGERSYDTTLYLISDGTAQDASSLTTRTFSSRNWLHSTDQIAELMRQAGFVNVQVVKDRQVYCQPVIIGSAP